MADARLYHSVAEKIMSLIHDGTYPPGSRLPGERDLAEQLKVSRVTIREAQIALQAQGHIRIKMGSGVYVQGAAGQAGQGLPQVSAFELTEARLLFESEAAALAARNISDETLARLETMIATMSSQEDEQASQQADQAFHLAIAAASGNAAVQHIVEFLWQIRTELPHVREAHASVCSKEDAGTRGAEHAEILVALRNHDPAAARTAMQKHFTRLLASMVDITEEQQLAEVRKTVTQHRQRYLNNNVAQLHSPA